MGIQRVIVGPVTRSAASGPEACAPGSAPSAWPCAPGRILRPARRSSAGRVSRRRADRRPTARSAAGNRGPRLSPRSSSRAARQDAARRRTRSPSSPCWGPGIAQAPDEIKPLDVLEVLGRWVAARSARADRRARRSRARGRAARPAAPGRRSAARKPGTRGDAVAPLLLRHRETARRAPRSARRGPVSVGSRMRWKRCARPGHVPCACRTSGSVWRWTATRCGRASGRGPAHRGRAVAGGAPVRRRAAPPVGTSRRSRPNPATPRTASRDA